MHILVINSGSSSIKFSLFDSSPPSPVALFDGELSGIGTTEAAFVFRDASGNDLRNNETVHSSSSLADAIHILATVISRPALPKVQAVGYRVVHPGPRLHAHQRITPDVMAELHKACAFAPLHNPTVISIIQETTAHFPALAHYACFDTVFHQTMPAAATTYALPSEYREQGVRRYGFHGLSCESIVHQLRDAATKKELAFPRRLIIAHLGNGCSVTAVEDGRSIDNTMGLTPTGGVVMGTRPGDLDPGLILYLLRQQTGEAGAQADALEKMLNRASGLLALSGLSNDMRIIHEAAGEGNQSAKLAIQVFTRSIKKAIGSALCLLGGVDAIVFAGGIGEHDAQSRHEILAGCESLGLTLDASSNEIANHGMRRISPDASAIAIYVVPAEEDRMIARHVDRLAQQSR